MVELFAAGGFASGPRLRSKSRFRLSPGRKLPTPAELSGPRGPGPLGRDLHPLRDITASNVLRTSRFFPVAPFPRDVERRRRQSGRHRWPSSRTVHPRKSGNRVLPRVKLTTHPRASDLSDRTPGLLCGTVLAYEPSGRLQVYSDEPPSNWTSHSRGIQLYESAPWRMVNPAPLDRLVRPVLPGGAAHLEDASNVPRHRRLAATSPRLQAS